MLPRELAPRFALSPAELFYESDPWTREIFAMGEMVQGRLEAEVARCVVDLNRDPDERPPDFPDGVVKSVTAYGKEVWLEDGFPTPDEIERLLDRYHRPYHEVLARTANRGSVRLGLDCHAMGPVGAPGDKDAGQKRPWFAISNFGDDEGEGEDTTCPASIMLSLKESIESEFGEDERPEDVDLVRMNYPRTGGYILERHGRGYTPWIQFEINHNVYMAEREDPNTIPEEVPDSDRELIATVRHRLLKVMANFAERLN